MKGTMVKLVIFLGCALFVCFFSVCKTTAGSIQFSWGSDSKSGHPGGSKKVGKGGPPQHAPAHGYRAKYAYRYYPSSCVYFDVSRKVYFYLEGDDWRMSVSLPRQIQVQVGGYVTLGLDTDKPYTRFKEHRQKYPPGQLKKKNKKRAKK